MTNTAAVKVKKEKKPSKIKAKMKNAGTKTKEFAKKQAAKVKVSAKKYKADVSIAYNTGYVRGWEDAQNIPNRIGAQSAAACGYKKGIRNRKRSDKYNAEYQKKRKK